MRQKELQTAMINLNKMSTHNPWLGLKSLHKVSEASTRADGAVVLT